MIPKIDEVDVEKSKLKHRVCIKHSGLDTVIQTIVLNLFAISPIYVSILKIFSPDFTVEFMELTIIITVSIFSILMIYRVNNVNRLRTIVGKGAKANRKLINQIIGEIGLTKTVDKKNHIIAESPMQLTSWGSIVIFILHEGNVLVNISTKGRAGSRSPFHFISESNIWRAIKSKFK